MAYVRHLIGLALFVGVAIGAYYAWRAIDEFRLLRMLPAGDIRTTVTELRLILQVLTAFFVASLFEWLWSKISPLFGESD